MYINFYCGTQDIRKNVKGTFQKFYLKVTINRTKKSENFVCFKENNEKKHTYVDVLFCRNEKDLLDLVEYWNRQSYDKTYEYRIVDLKDVLHPHLTVDQVIEEFQKMYGWKKLIMFNNEIRDIIS